MISAGGTRADAGNFAFKPVPHELQDGAKPEELEQLHPGGIFAEDAQGQVVWTYDNKDSLVVDGQVIIEASPHVLLKACAEYVGISTVGSRKTVWTRLKPGGSARRAPENV